MAVAIELQPRMPQCWNPESKPHKFCPGCGHGLVLKVLGQAIDELGVQDRTVFGCDIGCSLLSWDLFDVDSVQTHHGRTTPVLTGVKRANPDLIAVAYMGDGGGYAIGSQHLVNAAGRNERITVILCNNTNYAMTGGQMAPTTMPGQKTETSPYGRDVNDQGYPMLGPEMVAAITHEGAYVARGTVSKLRVLKGYIKKALENQMAGRGFSFVEALSTCPTNWHTNAQQTWAFLEDNMQRLFPVGELKVPAAGDDTATGKENQHG
jgi:2-oxoglutarate ferredoxin oxidoreductase subunit beta